MIYDSKEYWQNEVRLKKMKEKIFLIGLITAVDEEDCDKQFVKDVANILYELREDVESAEEELRKRG